MGNQCEQQSRADGTCQMAWIENPDGSLSWDTENYPIDCNGQCEAEEDEFPGDSCDAYQPDLAGDYCERCGEYLGYGDEEDDDGYEESECRCND